MFMFMSLVSLSWSKIEIAVILFVLTFGLLKKNDKNSYLFESNSASIFKENAVKFCRKTCYILLSYIYIQLIIILNQDNLIIQIKGCRRTKNTTTSAI